MSGMVTNKKEIHDTLPACIEAAANSTVILRNAQLDLLTSLINSTYILSLTPEQQILFNESLTSAIATGDDLIVRLAKLAEKNSSMNKLLELMINNQINKKSKDISLKEKDEYYDESVEKIKQEILHQIDIEQGIVESEDNTDEQKINKETYSNENIIDINLEDTKDEEDEEVTNTKEEYNPWIDEGNT
jgi:hypothetical protein